MLSAKISSPSVAEAIADYVRGGDEPAVGCRFFVEIGNCELPKRNTAGFGPCVARRTLSDQRRFVVPRDAANVAVTVPSPARIRKGTIMIGPACRRRYGMSATITARHAPVGSTRTGTRSTPLLRDCSIWVKAMLLIECCESRQNMSGRSQVRSTARALPRPSDGLRLAICALVSIPSAMSWSSWGRSKRYFAKPTTQAQMNTAAKRAAGSHRDIDDNNC